MGFVQGIWNGKKMFQRQNQKGMVWLTCRGLWAGGGQSGRGVGQRQKRARVGVGTLLSGLRRPWDPTSLVCLSVSVPGPLTLHRALLSLACDSFQEGRQHLEDGEKNIA